MTEKEIIPFNRPHFAGNEFAHISKAFSLGKISGDGYFTHKCHQFFCDQFGFAKVLLTTSCTDALEMSALLADIKPGDEVIIPSFTFPSTANAFALRGAKLVFADSSPTHPNLDISTLAPLITPKTKAIVPVHYAGVACDMAPLLELAREHDLFLIEDAAQAFDSYYKQEPLGKIGHFGAFSFHETKNISSGEGGLLAINNPNFFQRAEIIREKGTNRSAFFRGEIAKYSWVDVGSSFLPSDLIAAILYAQLETFESIQNKRCSLWNRYFHNLKPLSDEGLFELPYIPPYATNNAHMFYLICRCFEERQSLIDHLKKQGIFAIFHYVPLHSAHYFVTEHDGRDLPHCDRYSKCLLRLPLYCDLLLSQVDQITEEIYAFFKTPPSKAFEQLQTTTLQPN